MEDRGAQDDLTFTSNAANRLVTVASPTQTLASMVYDGLGRRVQLISGGVTTKYHYDSTERLIAISDANGNWSETIWLGDLPVAQASGSNLYAIHSDQVGQPVKMSNAAGALVWQRTAQPFGETYAEGGSIATVLRFPGQVADAATATHCNMARDYGPSLGRNPQSDPIGLAGGWNTYGYVGGNPVSRVDPEGLDYMARPDHWFTSGPFGIIAYVRDQVVPAMTGERVCIDYDGMARDMLVTAGLGATGGVLFKYGYGTLRGFGAALLRKGGKVGKRVGMQGGLGAAGAGPEVIQLSKARFGHAFAKHGQDATDFLTKRAAGSGMAQGQFLDNQAAARFIQDNLGKLGQGAVSLPVPKGFPARVIMPDGSFVAPSTIRLVPGSRGVKTAYPEI